MNKKLKTKQASIWLACLTVLALFAASCGDDEPAPDTSAADQAALEQAEADAAAAQEEAAAAEAEAEAEAEAAEAAEEPMEEMSMTPGEGVSVTMARANWTTGYMQAAIYHHLLEELGYEVSEPADLELGPSNAYVAMAQREFDFWANSWYPNHDPFIAGTEGGTLPDGSVPGDHVSVIGEEMLAGGLEGLLTNKSLVDEHGIRTLDQIMDDAALFEIYESTDPSPGDGVLQILGCIEGWGCHVALRETIELAGWSDRLEQLEVGGYDAVIADAVARANAGTPFIAYTWTPSGYVTQLIPGNNAMWLAQEADSVHDGSITPGFRVDAPAALSTDVCTNDPCYLFRNSADVLVTANNDFLAENPAAASLLEQVKINVVDVALQNVLYDGGENTTDDVNRHAAEWIEANRAIVDEWLAVARAAA